MDITTIFIYLSSFSFFGYALSYFLSPHMSNEFKRFGLEKLALFVIILQILGATGLLVGLMFKPVLLISSLGLALLMFNGVIVRLRLKDSFGATLPALFFMVLNAYIFAVSLA